MKFSAGRNSQKREEERVELSLFLMPEQVGVTHVYSSKWKNCKRPKNLLSRLDKEDKNRAGF